MKTVNTSIRKKDAIPLITGKPVYTDDITPEHFLTVKILRSPHAHANILSIDTEAAKKLEGIECIITHEEAPKTRFTTAGQSFPEVSPYDRLILDPLVRSVGDPVAIIAGWDSRAVHEAMNLIKVEYEVLTPLLDFREALNSDIIVHPEEDFLSLVDVGADNKKNLCAKGSQEIGDVEKELAECAYVVNEKYYTLANNQAMMETFRTHTSLDPYGRLVVTTSTQVPFHVRRILATALEIPKSKIRVIKPRIGGGFGAKQSSVSEIYPALVTMMTGHPAKLIFTREESMTCGRPRHESEISVRVGADKEGNIKAIHMHSLWNAGAYGDHGPSTVGLSGHKAMTIYNKIKASKFDFDVVYTNTMGGGAFRGYGAPQGFFALESAVNELAAKMNMDPTVLRRQNMLDKSQVGDVMPTYYHEILGSCHLDSCLSRAKEMIDWDEKFPARDMGNNKVRGVGCALAMQGSGISNVDVGAVEIRLNDDGFYTLLIGATDMGTGCDTILAQMAAESLECHVDNVVVHGVDTDLSPYDTGSYASSTTYITGMAVVKTCEKLRAKILEEGARILDLPVDVLEFDGEKVFSLELNKEVSLKDIGNLSLVGQNKYLTASESHFSATSPPPFMAGAVEVEVDTETGEVEIIDYVAVVDCGTTINPNLAKIQVEGGIVQGIGMALYEDIVYDKKGRVIHDSFMKYKIPSRLDVGNIRVEFDSSYEPTGPFGAKSIGEVVINTPSPALANAIYNATKVMVRDLPITSEKVAMGMLEQELNPV